MRVLGIDPGYERLGIAVLERNTETKKPFDKTQGKERVVFSECFKTKSSLDFSERLLLIGSEVQKVIKKYKPEVLSIETLFLTTNQKTVMHVAEARGVIIYEAVTAGLKIFEATPLQIKVAVTGYGRADKTQINKMVKMLVDISDSKPRQRNGQESDDELDAIAIALTAFSLLKQAR